MSTMKTPDLLKRKRNNEDILDTDDAGRLMSEKKRGKQPLSTDAEVEKQEFEMSRTELAACETNLHQHPGPYFEHVPLESAAEQIRLLTVLPGGPDDVIQLRLSTHWLRCGEYKDRRNKDDEESEACTKACGKERTENKPSREGHHEDSSDHGNEHSCAENDTSGQNVEADPLARYVHFSKVPPYSAISYTWGNMQTRLIVIDGKPLYVRENCEYALWQFRLHFPGELVWIDSISIDQDNDKEKSSQVRMMWDIYRNASRILSCIGPHANNSEQLAEAITEVAELLADRSWSEFDYEEWAISRGRDYMASLGQALFPFCNRPYWTRIWIIQEFQAAEELKGLGHPVLCGHNVLQFKALLAIEHFLTIRLNEDDVLARLSWNRLETEGLQNNHMGNMRGIIHFRALDPDNLLNWAMVFHCSDPRDKIYGLLPLIRWPPGFPAIKADYSISADALLAQIAPIISHHRLVDAFRALNVDFYGTGWPDLMKSRLRLFCSDENKFYGLGASSRAAAAMTSTVERKAGPIATCWQKMKGKLASIIRPDVLHPSASANIADEVEVALQNLISEVACPDCWQRSVSSPLDLASMGLSIPLPQSIVVRSEVIALVSHEARPGDLLVQRSKGFLLLVRLRDHGTYDIVGQGLMLRPQDRNSCAWCPGQYRTEFFETLGGDTFCVDGEIRVSGEDQLLMFSQLALASEVFHNSDLLCLITQPVADAQGAIAMKLHYPQQFLLEAPTYCGPYQVRDADSSVPPLASKNTPTASRSSKPVLQCIVTLPASLSDSELERLFPNTDVRSHSLARDVPVIACSGPEAEALLRARDRLRQG